MDETFQYRQKEESLIKKKKSDNHYFRWGLTAFLVLAAAIVFCYMLFHGANIRKVLDIISNVFQPVVVGFVMAYLLTPILNFVEYRLLLPLCNKFKIKEIDKWKSLVRGIGITITIVLFFTIIYGLIYMLLSQIIPSITEIVHNFDKYIDNVTTWVNRLLKDNPQVEHYALNLIENYSEDIESFINNDLFVTTGELIKKISLSVISVLAFLWDFIIGLVISIYVMASKEKFAGQSKKIVYAFFETSTANVIVNNFRFTHKTFIGFVSGKVLDSIIIGMICFIGTTLLNTPYAALISLIIGVTNVIPFFGPYIGAIPSIILIFVVDPSHPLNALYFAIFILALQQFDGNILGPKILGDSTGLAGFWVLFSITVFGGLFGVLGMIIGVPVFAVIYAAIKSLVNISLERRKLPKETEVYLNVKSIEADGFKEYIPDYKKVTKKKRTVSSKKKENENDEE